MDSDLVILWWWGKVIMSLLMVNFAPKSFSVASSFFNSNYASIKAWIWFIHFTKWAFSSWVSGHSSYFLASSFFLNCQSPFFAKIFFTGLAWFWRSLYCQSWSRFALGEAWPQPPDAEIKPLSTAMALFLINPSFHQLRSISLFWLARWTDCH